MWKYFTDFKSISTFKFEKLSLYKTIYYDRFEKSQRFVFYVDMLGFTALTQDKIQLTKDDFNIWQVSKYFQTLGNQEFAANILILFVKS